MSSVVYILLFAVTAIIIYNLLTAFKQVKYKKIVSKMGDNKLLYLLTRKVDQLKYYYPSSKILKPLSSVICLFVAFSLQIIFFVLFKIIIGINSTAFILSIPFSSSPFILIKILSEQYKKKVLQILPIYAVNIKNHISGENNILLALKNTTVEEPLKKHISHFNANISLGMNVNNAFDMLISEVNVKEFEDLIVAFKVCQKNGGNFIKVLEKYINIITKKMNQKEETKEKAYSSIITLIVMVGLNIFAVVFFIFGNEVYVSTIINNFIGHVILDINAMSYMFIAYLISKIYKEE